MGRKPCIYSQPRINGRTTSCVWHGRRLYLTCVDVDMRLVRFHGFSSETGREPSYQSSTETDEAVRERQTRHRQTDSQAERPRADENKDSGVRV